MTDSRATSVNSRISSIDAHKFHLNDNVELSHRETTDTEYTDRTSRHRYPDFDKAQSVEFVAPIEGTPAALALAANAKIVVTKLDKGFHKFRAWKRPKMKSLNLVKKLNKTTKMKKRALSPNFKGKVIDGVHEQYTLTAGMILGIRFSVKHGYEVADPSAEVHQEFFNEVENVAFPAKGNTLPPYITPPHPLVHTFKFKTYAPKVFKSIREFFDIDPTSYMNSVCGDYNYIEFISNSKSGQFFFYSHDGKYMLKTQTKEENKFLKQILPNYYQYLKTNPHSLMVRILGMHRIKMYHLRRKVHFVIMSSVFDTPAKINTIYDLKGSLIGRCATPKERETGGVLKDQDMISDECKLHFGAKKAAFMKQLRSDAEFLASLQIMDYSLLVGIHDRKTRHTESMEFTVNANAPNGMISAVGNSLSSNHVSVDHPHNEAGLPANPTSPVLFTKSNTPLRRSIHASIVQGNDLKASLALLQEQHLQQSTDNAHTHTHPHHIIAHNETVSSNNNIIVHAVGDEIASNSNLPSTESAAISQASSAVVHYEQVYSKHDVVNSDEHRIATTFLAQAREDPNSPERLALRRNSRQNMFERDKSEDQRDAETTKSVLASEASARLTADREEELQGIHRLSVSFETKESSRVPFTPSVEQRQEGDEQLHGDEESDGSVSSESDDEDFNIDEGDSDSDQSPVPSRSSSQNYNYITRPLPAPPTSSSVSSTTASTTTTNTFRNSLSFGGGLFGAFGNRNSTTTSAPATTPVAPSNPPATTGTQATIDATTSLFVPDDISINYGNGITVHKPWTSRKDGGINSREIQSDHRGDEIYFLGIIDILQRYNTNKRVETMVKGLTNDVKQISSVDSVSYARRFIKFMDNNID